MRSFDVATFVAFGAAHLGIAGSDVLMEFDYPEIYAPIDLGIGKCRLAVAEPAEMAGSDDPRRWSHVRIATKYPEVTRRHFAARGVQAECVKLSGAMELAPSLGLSHRIVDLVDSGRTLRDNGLVEIEHIADVTSRFIVNRAALKTQPQRVGQLGRPLPRGASCRLGSTPRRRVSTRISRRSSAATATPTRMSTAWWPTSSPTCARAATRRSSTTRASSTRSTPMPRACASPMPSVMPRPRKVPAAQREALDVRRQAHRGLPSRAAAARTSTSPTPPARGSARAIGRSTAVGVYVPGGTAAYPSSVLMNIVPAKVAGVKRIVMVVPTPDGVLNPLVMLAAEIAGADEVWRIGGAQAVAALAYGTQSIKPVDKIIGPGNAYVAAAKRRVFGQVGIDLIAGPSEILVVADRHNDPAWIAADLLSQAEHDASSQSVLITDDAAFAEAVAGAVDAQLKAMPRAEIAGASWRDNGCIILVRDLGACAPIVDRIAAEHVELAMEAEPAEALADRIAPCRRDLHRPPHARGDRRLCRRHQPRAADLARGALLGRPRRRRLPEAHLDRGLHARSRWPRSARAALALAEAEGLDAHGRSVSIRLNRR